MSKLLLVLCLVMASNVWAAEPRPAVKSAGEVAWEAIPDSTPDEAQVRIAKEYLDMHPNDIPLLRSVQNVLNRKSDLTVEFWKERMDKTPSATNRYLWARKTGDPAEMKTVSEWIMQNEPNNFWGYYLAATAEWSKDEPDLKFVTSKFEMALEKDPSRLEGWSYGADAYEQAKDFDNALRMYQAIKVVDPSDKQANMSIMGIYAQKRDADKYFQMVADILPKSPPLNFDLGMHGTENKMTSASFAGKYTVLEMFTYW